MIEPEPEVVEQEPTSEQEVDNSLMLHPAVTVWLTQRQITLISKAASTWGCDLELFVNHFLQLRMTGEARDERVYDLFVREMFAQGGQAGNTPPQGGAL